MSNQVKSYNGTPFSPSLAKRLSRAAFETPTKTYQDLTAYSWATNAKAASSSDLPLIDPLKGDDKFVALPKNVQHHQTLDALSLEAFPDKTARMRLDEVVPPTYPASSDRRASAPEFSVSNKGKRGFWPFRENGSASTSGSSSRKHSFWSSRESISSWASSLKSVASSRKNSHSADKLFAFPETNVFFTPDVAELKNTFTSGGLLHDFHRMLPDGYRAEFHSSGQDEGFLRFFNEKGALALETQRRKSQSKLVPKDHSCFMVEGMSESPSRIIGKVNLHFPAESWSALGLRGLHQLEDQLNALGPIGDNKITKGIKPFLKGLTRIH
jgi:hypothetical protein